MRRSLKLTLLARAVAAACLAAAPSHAQWVVYDPGNWIQNLTQAINSYEQIENQISQLEHEAENLRKIGVSSGPEIEAIRARMRALMQRAEGIALEIEATEQAWARDYPESYAELDHDEMVQSARAQWANARHALGVTLATQAEVVGSTEEDAETLARLLAASQSASGNLDATQATNELLGLSVSQQSRTQQLLAAQARAEALARARELEETEAARVRRERFLGDGKAYTREE